MIILDTNVISEPMKPQAEPVVSEWLRRQAPETLYLTAINLAELLVGIAKLPAGRRKDNLRAALQQVLDRLFGARFLPFDRDAAQAFAYQIGVMRATGRQIGWADGQIAAIATVHGYTVATRDTEPFEAAGVPVINPWEEHQAI